MSETATSLPGQIDFLTDLAFTLKWEGGLTDDPNDPGGITNLGATVASWSTWTGHAATAAAIRALTVDQVTPFYHALYWNAVRAWGLPAGVARMVFDHAVNAGPGTSAYLLQRTVAPMQGIYAVALDGRIGAITTGAARAVGAARLLPALRDAQLADYRSKSDAGSFLAGWANRLADRYATACQQAGVPA